MVNDMKCPVCNNESTKNVCPVCGYSLINDLLNSRFLNKLSKQEIDEYKEQICIQKKVYLRSIEAKSIPEIKNHYTQEEKKLGEDYYKQGYSFHGKKDYKNAIKLYELSAQCGNDKSYLNLGYIYSNRKIDVYDDKKAFECYRKASSLGNAIAYTRMGYIYIYGEGVNADAKKAIECYEKAIQLGDKDAINDLASAYFFGEGCIEQDFIKARYYFEKYIDSGDLLYRETVFSNLATIYQKGYGVSKDSEKARYYQNESIKNSKLWEGSGIFDGFFKKK